LPAALFENFPSLIADQLLDLIDVDRSSPQKVCQHLLCFPIPLARLLVMVVMVVMVVMAVMAVTTARQI
jgi:hypothetical protein